DTLAIELAGLIELDFAVEVTGFDMGEIELILLNDEEDAGGKEKTGAGAKTAKSTCGPAVSRRGHVWRLRPHQPTCADSPGPAAWSSFPCLSRLSRLRCRHPALAEISWRFSDAWRFRLALQSDRTKAPQTRADRPRRGASSRSADAGGSVMAASKQKRQPPG